MIVASAAKRAGALLLSACALALVIDAATTGIASASSTEEPAHSAALDEAIIKSAARHGVPESLVRRIVMRESKYNARARNHSYWGLMQISYPTAKSMGFRGSPQELLNPIVNLRYAVPYLANAFVIAGKRQDAAVRLYASGYYDTARRRGLLGLLRTADSAPLSGVPDEPEVVAAAAPEPEQNSGIFGALFGPQQMQRDPQTQQVAYASATPQPADVTPQAALPGGKQGEDVALTTDKHGDLQPPKKWQHDGGSTVIARGEQAVEKIAAYEKAAVGTDEPDKGKHRSRKTTVFAALDEPPAGAQAYAATAGSQDPRLMQADSQAAIQQATAGQSQAAPAQAVLAAAVSTPVASADEPAKSRKHRVARRGRHRDAPAEAVAQAPDAAQPQQAAAPQPMQMQDGQAPQQAPVEQAATDPRQGAPAPQPAVDASGYPADAGGAQRTTEAQADEPAPAKPKRHAHHARTAHKTAIAAQSPDDGKSQAPAQ